MPVFWQLASLTFSADSPTPGHLHRMCQEIHGLCAAFLGLYPTGWNRHEPSSLRPKQRPNPATYAKPICRTEQTMRREPKLLTPVSWLTRVTRVRSLAHRDLLLFLEKMGSHSFYFPPPAGETTWMGPQRLTDQKSPKSNQWNIGSEIYNPRSLGLHQALMYTDCPSELVRPL